LISEGLFGTALTFDRNAIEPGRLALGVRYENFLADHGNKEALVWRQNQQAIKQQQAQQNAVVQGQVEAGRPQPGTKLITYDERYQDRLLQLKALVPDVNDPAWKKLSSAQKKERLDRAEAFFPMLQSQLDNPLNQKKGKAYLCATWAADQLDYAIGPGTSQQLGVAGKNTWQLDQMADKQWDSGEKTGKKGYTDKPKTKTITLANGEKKEVELKYALTTLTPDDPRFQAYAKNGFADLPAGALVRFMNPATTFTKHFDLGQPTHVGTALGNGKISHLWEEGPIQETVTDMLKHRGTAPNSNLYVKDILLQRTPTCSRKATRPRTRKCPSSSRNSPA